MSDVFRANNRRFAATAAMLDHRLTHAIEVIRSIYDDIVYVKPKTLSKYASHITIGTADTTIMPLPGSETNETYVADNLITHFSSSDAGDTQSIIIEGHTLASSNFTFVTQEVTLAGQTKTALTTPLARCSRLYNNGATDFAGDIYVYEDDTVVAGVPQTNTKVHMLVPDSSNNHNQSTKCATTTSQYDYWLITEVQGSIDQKTACSVDFEIQVRNFGKTFRTIHNFTLNSGGASTFGYIFDPCLIVQKNSDIRMRAIGSTTNIDISAGLNGYLALIDTRG